MYKYILTNPKDYESTFPKAPASSSLRIWQVIYIYIDVLLRYPGTKDIINSINLFSDGTTTMSVARAIKCSKQLLQLTYLIFQFFIGEFFQDCEVYVFEESMSRAIIFLGVKVARDAMLTHKYWRTTNCAHNMSWKTIIKCIAVNTSADCRLILQYHIGAIFINI